jgi:hypothetical protein
LSAQVEVLAFISFHEHFKVLDVHVLLSVEVGQCSLVFVRQSSKISVSTRLGIVLDAEGHGGIQAIIFIVIITAAASGPVALLAIFVLHCKSWWLSCLKDIQFVVKFTQEFSVLGSKIHKVI